MKKAFNLILFLAFTLSAAAQFEGDGDGFGDGNFQLPGIINLSSNQAGAGSAIDFDGINDFVSVDHYSNLNSYSSSGGLTIEFWFSPDSLHGTQSWLSKTTNSNDSGYVIKTVGTQMLCSLKMGSIWETVSFTVVEGTWQHVAFVASENQKVVAYLDGIQQGSSTSSSNFTSNTNSLILGSGNGAEYANGKMDELRIWYVDLDSTTIRDYISKRLDFNHPHISLISDISLYFQFDENTGDSLVSSLTDDSPGVLSNMNFNNAWVRSGAALGDESSFTFGGITLSHTLGSGAVVTVSNFTTTPTSISIFREGNTPEGTTFPTELDSSIISEYFGVRVNGGGTFDVEIDYSGSEEYGSRSPVSTLRAYRRDNSSSASYTAASGFFGTDVSASTITINTNSSGEFIFGFTNNSYPEESGSGYALDFDGLNQSGNIGNRTDLSFNHDNSFTIEAWVSTTASSQRTIVSKMLNSGTFRGYDFLIRDGQLELYLISTWSAQVINVRGNDLVNDGKWHHVAVTYDGTNNVNGVKLYVDGVVQSNNVLRSGSIAGGLTNSADVVLGNRGGSHDFIGQMDEVRVWSNDLSEMEIRNWMSRKISSEHPQFSELKAYFKFDENTGTTAQDLITSNQASLINTPTWVVSGAELGDDVTFTYGGTFVLDTLSSGTVVSIENFTGNPDAVFLYVVSDTAKNSSYPNIANFSIIDSFQYVGVNMIGGTSYDVVFDFSNNPAFTTSDFVRTVVAFKRSNGADGSWEQVTGPLSVDVANKTLTIEGQTGTEYVLGFTNTTFPNEPGSGYALSFDGIDDYVRIPNGGFTLGNEFTIQTWVSPNSGYGAFANGHVDIVGQWGSGGVGNAAYHLSFNPSGQVLFQIHNGVSNSTAVSSSVVSINEWTHVAVTRSALGAVQIYINGVADGSIIAGSAPQVSTNYDIIIGASATLTNNVNASIDEVSFWNTDLSQSEIRDWMTKKLNSFHPSFSDLISYYRFDENAGTTLTDLVGGNDGTLTNGPIWLTSGAALGDSSAYTYGGTEVVLNYPNSDQLTINNFSGSPDGAHLFYVNDTSNVTTTPDGIDTMLTIGYGGSFVVGGTSPTYDVKYSYNSNPFTSKQEEEVVLVKRGTNADPGYSQGNLSERVTAGGQVGEANVSGRSEFLLGSGANNALSFDGIDDQVVVPHSSSLNFVDGDFTLEAWVYPEATGNETILSKGHGGATIQDVYIFQIQSNKIALELGGATSGFEWQFSNTNVPINQWSHVAATFDYATQTVTFYLNGVQDGVKTYSLAGINNTDTNSMYIGRQGWSCNCNFFDGKIDEVKIWGRALCSEELDAIRNCESPKNTTDLVAYYNFNQGSASGSNTTITTLVDNSSGGNDGTLTSMSLNGTTSNWVAGTDSISGECSSALVVCGGYPVEPGPGYALSFDGVDDYVQGPDQDFASGNDARTMEAWIRTTKAGTSSLVEYGSVTPNQRSGLLCVNSHLYFVGEANDLEGTRRINDGNWHHVAMTHDGTTTKLYVDGVLDGSVAKTLATSSTHFRIGMRGSFIGEQFDGNIDEVRIWNIDLTQTEIRTWMTKKINSTHPEFTNLTAYYRFDEKSGTILQDAVGGNDGTLNNMNPATDWVNSGAALGDNSIYTYGGTSVSNILSNDVNVTVNNFQGTPDGVHLYVVTDTAQGSTYPNNTLQEDSTSYFGVFMVGGDSYDLISDYSTTEISTDPEEVLLRTITRENGSDISWQLASGEFGVDTIANTITVDNQKRGEYTYATVATQYPVEPGSGYALDFDGDTSYVDLGFIFDPSVNNFTLEAWVYIDSLDGDQIIFQQLDANGRSLLYVTDSGNVKTSLGSTGTGSTTVIPKTWNHISMTWTGSVMRLYLNGVMDGSFARTASSATGGIRIGKAKDSNSANLRGKIDEARIWNTALDQVTLREWMTKKVTNSHGNIANLLAYYRFDENTGSTLEDLAGGNSGTLVNGPTWVISGAALGDSSVFAYPAATLNIDGNISRAALSNFTGGADGVHLYFVNDTANQTTIPTGLNSLGINRGYYGTFITGGTNPSYDVNLTYLTVPSNELVEYEGNLATRETNTDSWIQAPLQNRVIDTLANRIDVSGFAGRTEFALASGANNAIDFDGVDDYIQVNSNSSLNFAGAFTAECWFYRGANTFGSLISQWAAGTNRRWELDVSSTGQLKVHISDDGTNNFNITSLETAAMNEWHHATVVFWPGDSCNLYLDGSKLTSQTTIGVLPSTINNSSIDLNLSRSAGGGNYFNGEIDEVKIWNRALCVDELSFNRNCEYPGNTDSLLVYYNFNQGSASSTNTGLDSLIDLSGNGNVGTLINMGLSGTASNWVAGSDSVAGGCGAFGTAPITVALSFNTITCNGGSDGWIKATASGANSYTYNWSNSATTDSIFSLTAGTYIVTVTNQCGATAVDSVAITEPKEISLVFDSTNVSCSGNSDGSAKVTATGGTPGYTYLWSNSLSTDTISGLATGTYSVTVQDANSCSAIGSVNISTAVDTTSPVAITQNITVYLDATGSASISASEVDNGSTDNCSSPTLSVNPSSFACSETGDNIVTLTATDAEGNVSTATAIVTVSDTNSPAVAINPFTLYLDNSGNVQLTDSTIAFNTVEYFIEDADLVGFSNAGACGGGLRLSSSSLESWTWTDKLSSGAGADSVVIELIMHTAITSNNFTYSFNGDSLGQDFGVGAGGCSRVLKTIKLDLNSYNFGSLNSFSWDLPDGQHVLNNNPTWGGAYAKVTVYSNNAILDNCSGSDSTTISFSQSSFSCTDIGPNNISFTVVDNQGNSSSTSAIVTISDTTSPVALAQNITVYLDATGSASISASEVDNGSTDNCSSPTLSVNPSSFACSETGDNIVTLTATDAEGNASTATAIVTVSDTNSPVIAINPFTLYLDNSGNAQLTDSSIAFNTTEYFIERSDLIGFNGIGACGGSLIQSSSSLEGWTWIDNLSTNAGIDSIFIEITMHFPATASNYSYSLNGDSLGQDFGVGSGGCSRVLKTIKLDVSSYNFGALNTFNWDLPDGGQSLNNNPTWGGAYARVLVYSNNTFIDNCSNTDSSSISFSQSSFSCSDIGSNNVTFSVADNQGNTSIATAIVTIADSTSPIANAQDITVYLDGAGNASITTGDIDNGSTDNCGTVTLSLDQTSFTCANLGANTVTLTANDGTNTSSATAIVTVADSTSPIANAQDITVYLDGAGNASITTGDIDNGSTDNCGTVTLSLDQTSFTCANVGANTVTLTANDGTNTSSATAIVTVADSTSPIANAQDITVYLDGAGNASITTGDIDNGSTDNCGTVTLSLDQTSFTCTNVGANTVTLTANDGTNTSSATAIVTVADSTSPAAVAQNITVYLDGAGNASITTGDIDNGSTDNCGTVTLSLDQTSFTCTNVGANTVTLTANDGTNTSSATAIVNVADSTSPIANAQDITVYLDGAGNASITTGDIDNGSTDNCGTVTLSLDQTSFTCTNVGANSVTLTANDGANTSTATAVVTVVDTISPLISAQDITVYINASGTVNIDSSDVIGNSVDNCSISSITLSQTSFTCANTGANNVTVMVRDQSNNFTSATAVVTVLDTNTYNWADVNELSSLSCFGDSSASLVAVVSGRTSPFNYTWNDASITDTIKNLKSATYFVTITDGLGCSDSAQFFVSEPGQISASITIDANVSCNGFANGTATANATGGTMPYTYLWSNSATSASITGVTAGTYSVTITDANGCNETSSGVVTEPNLLVVSTSSVTDVTCNGAADGSALVSVVGGTSPYSYNWSNGSTSNTLSGVSSGNYSVIVTDALGCQDSLSVVINEPAALSAGGSAGTAVSCAGGSDGTVTTGASGGTAPYSFNWSTGDTTISVSGLSVGTYSVTITDANGCTITNNVGVTEPSPVVITATVDNNVICNGEANGSATASASGGSSVIYNYMWSNGASVANATGLAAGNYSVTVTTSKGCVDTTSITISEPAAVVLSMGTGTSPSCNGFSDGSIVPSVTGAVSPISYLWSNGATTDRLLNIAAGTYQLTVTDFNGCTATDSLTISEPAALVINTTAGNITCNGGADGFADLDVTGGTTPYSYNWSNGSVSDSIAGLIAGTYSYTITDANGCAKVDSVVLTESAAINTSLATTDVNCNGQAEGSASVSVTGGATPYSFTWSNGDTTANVLNLIAGNYTVTITDANGCTDTSSAVIIEPSALVASTVVDSNVTCKGFMNGGATASTTGGTTPYAYQWSNGAATASITGVSAGFYSVTVTDANACQDTSSVMITEPLLLTITTTQTATISCNGGNDAMVSATFTGGVGPFSVTGNNGSSGITQSNSINMTNISVGTFILTVTDANGCVAIDSLTIIEPTAVSATINIDANVSCNGFANGIASVSGSGGTGNYSYFWSTGDTTSSVTGLSTGNYSVTVIDANSCTSAATAVVSEPSVLVANAAVDSNVTCSGLLNGGATASQTGGTAPYSYLWSNADTTASISNLGVGAYSVTITDANGCEDTSSVTISEPLPISASSVIINSSCNGVSDGYAKITVTGGTLPYSYNWSNGSISDSIAGVAAGIYRYTITDANSCNLVDSLVNVEPPAITGVDTIITCDSSTWIDGNTYFTSNNSATFTIVGAGANGCDSTVTLNLTINNTKRDTTALSSCDSYTWPSNNQTYMISGIYSDTTAAVSGCDSITSIDLTINNSVVSVLPPLVECDSYLWPQNGQTYTASGVYRDTVPQVTINGCDSIYELDLTINNSTTGTDVLVACDSLTWIDGVTYFASNNTATFVLTNAQNCDSTVTLDLTINNSVVSVLPSLVECDSYLWPQNGQTYTASGVYRDTVPQVTINGCDSIYELDLTINNSTTGTDVLVVCDSLTWIDGVTYFASNNTATFVLTNSQNCDSTVTLDLTINNSVVSVLPSLVACDSYLWPQNGQTYTTSGVYRDTVPQVTINGCDSIYELDLTINNSTTGTDVLVACDSLTWIDGVTYFASNNTATFVLTNSQNCDSTVTLDLTINNSVVSVLPSLVECDSYLWPQNGQTYTASGVYRDTVPQVTINGCDSIYELDLTINNSTIGTDVLVACDSLTWIDGVTYFASNNTATFVLTNAQNCDSTVTLDLTINNSVVSVLPSLVECDSYLWPQNGQTYTVSGVYRDTVPQVTINGCDSIYELDLTINNSTTGTDVLVACDSLTWIDGVTYFASNNTATFVLVNAQNCDSTVTLDLTINNSVVSVLPSLVACDSYLWPQNGQTYTTSGVYRDTVPQVTINGCDSIYELDLTINNSTTGTDVLVVCDSLTWIDGVTYFASNNTATFVLTNAQNCDSTVTLDLTINNSVVSVLPSLVACDSYLWPQNGQTYTASGVYRDTVPQVTINGCDSIYELDLTINNSTTGTDVLVACDSLTWIDGVTYFASNNTATFVLTNSQNCDSTVTLDLTINNSAIGIDTQVACDSYTWIDGTNYTSSNSTATFTITGGAANGCDSTVTLDLTINNTLRDTTSITACDSYFWSANSQTYTMSGIYSDTTQVNGCDSITSVDLTIDTIVIANSGNDQTICEVDFIPLNATPVNAGVGSWSSASGFVQFSDTNSTNATASGLIFGANDLYWSIENGSCPIVRDTVVINRANNPTVSLGPDSTVFKDDQTTLVANSSVDGQQGIAYNWDPAFYLSSSFGRTVVTNSFLEATTEFRVEVTSPEGCFGRDSILLTINEMVTFSGAFTPNGDGKNDLWLIKNIQDPSIASHEVNIFDSFGSEVFRSTNFQGWDGKFGGSDLPVASYYYSVRLNFANGESRIETGLVSILR